MLISKLTPHTHMRLGPHVTTIVVAKAEILLCRLTHVE